MSLMDATYVACAEAKRPRWVCYSLTGGDATYVACAEAKTTITGEAWIGDGRNLRSVC